MYTPQELYEKKWLRVNTDSWDVYGSLRINGIYQAAGFCAEDLELLHTNHLVVYCHDGKPEAVWVGHLEPAFDSANPTRQEVEMFRMLGYQLPEELFN